ncbi:OmpA family protein [Methyloversatilis thermotolerans]|uniref:OmpA family protein n=1 Tax=Methyloversatilis thermotolerans TaxID=1346290 RepID=UPI000368B553|nr:OmpA family protein [Methyloversatilis thermotolerans]
MLKQLTQKTLLIALLASTAGVSINASAAEDIKVDPKIKAHVPYVIDSRGVVVRNATGLCWRTGFWTPAYAASVPEVGCACDKDLLPKDVCEPPAPAPAPAPKAEPAPAPAPAPKPAAQKVTLAADALFDFDKAVLRPEGKSKIDEAVSKLNTIELEVIIAVGHADRIGKDKYNQTLSEKRAAAVKDYLVSKGVEANRVYTEGKGESQPVTGDSCKKMGKEHRSNKKLVECLQPDRRVEIEIIGTQK